MEHQTTTLRTAALLFTLTTVVAAQPGRADAQGRVLKGLTDPQTGLVPSHLPVPPSWNLVVENNRYLIKGPGVLVSHLGSPTFIAPGQDAFTNQMIQQGGGVLRPVPASIQVLFESDVKPELAKRGWRLTRVYDLPDIVRAHAAIAQQGHTGVPVRHHLFALGSDWTDSHGQAHVVVFVAHVMQGNPTMWSHRSVVMDVTGDFDAAKGNLLFALANERSNPQYVAAMNGQTQQHLAQQNAQHQANMRAMRAAGDAQMEAYRARSAASDRSHQAFINGIREVDVVNNPATGQTLEVSAGSQQVWANGDNQVIHSNDAFYDPNADPNLQGGWHQTRPVE